MSDRLRLVGAVDAIDRAADIERPGAHRIARAASHEPRQIGLTLDHLRRRTPVRPFLLADDAFYARPLKTITANADAITNGAVFGLDEVEITIRRMHDDRARFFCRAEEHDLAFVGTDEVFLIRTRRVAGLVVDLHIDLIGGRPCICRYKAKKAGGAHQ